MSSTCSIRYVLEDDDCEAAISILEQVDKAGDELPKRKCHIIWAKNISFNCVICSKRFDCDYILELAGHYDKAQAIIAKKNVEIKSLEERLAYAEMVNKGLSVALAKAKETSED